MGRHLFTCSSDIDLRIIQRLLDLSNLTLVRDDDFTEDMKEYTQVTNRASPMWMVISQRPDFPPIFIGSYVSMVGLTMSMYKHWKSWGFKQKPPSMEIINYILVAHQWQYLCSEEGKKSFEAMNQPHKDLEYITKTFVLPGQIITENSILLQRAQKGSV